MIQVPIHVVDSTLEEMVQKDDWRKKEVMEIQAGISVPVGTQTDAGSLINVPTEPTYAFAFAVVAKSTDWKNTIAEENAVSTAARNMALTRRRISAMTTFVFCRAKKR